MELRTAVRETLRSNFINAIAPVAKRANEEPATTSRPSNSASQGEGCWAGNYSHPARQGFSLASSMPPLSAYPDGFRSSTSIGARRKFARNTDALTARPTSPKTRATFTSFSPVQADHPASGIHRNFPIRSAESSVRDSFHSGMTKFPVGRYPL